MKTWLLVSALGGVGGPLIALGLSLRKRWLARARTAIDAAIATQKDGLYYTYPEADESLDVRARLRKDIADRKRQQAAAVSSGSSSRDVLKMVRK